MWFKSKEKTPPASAAQKPKDLHSQLGLDAGVSPAAVRTKTVNPHKGESIREVYDEEVQLHDMQVRARRRLIGAAVLLLGAFLILPWVFDNARKQTAASVTVAVPDKNIQFEVRNPNANKPEASASANATTSSSTTSPAATTPSASSTPATNNVVATPPKPEPSPPADKPTPPVQKYAVHIGLVSDGVELDALLKKLRAAGVEPQLKTVTLDGVSKTRVRLGLFDTTAQAEAARKKIIGVAKNPIVIPITREP